MDALVFVEWGNRLTTVAAKFVVIPLTFVGICRLLDDVNEYILKLNTNHIYCRLLSYSQAFFVGISVVMVAAILTERWVATYDRKYYEHRGTRKAKTYAVGIFAHGVAYSFLVHYFGTRFKATFPNRCCVVDRYPVIDGIGLFACGTVTMCLTPVMIYLYYYNKRLMNNRVMMESLSARFQLAENIMILRCFIPVFIVGFLIIGSLGFWTSEMSAFLSVVAPDYVITMKVCIRISRACADSLCIAIVVIFCQVHPALRSRMRNYYNRIRPNQCSQETAFIVLRSSKVTDYQKETEDYFQQLESQWNKLQKR
ncbi:unnamed protein product [Bursaphelenchus xylophilus]|uniref:(pine wood nematode) hypothetical protein n=1 Tax=Bursaphelenchus xylophilus TaxID=6326 RepID=A0A7I8WZF8_BURXY|nr:unnamed protein product [Bursaphelenchus xylophilus]CAG9129345.1 unnamed protein product [Bursaphelenchus xylophilus]